MFHPVVQTAMGKQYGPQCATMLQAEKALSRMVSQHIASIPMEHLLKRTVIGIHEIQVGGATFRIEKGSVPL